MQEEDWYRNAIIYGVDIARFYDSDGDGMGDILGVVDKLDYIQSLGVTCLWLLPFFPSDRRDNGYDVTAYKAVDSRFGTLHDFRRLIHEAHERGLKVILDLVVHHTSDQHPWFIASSSGRPSRYRDYYVWADEPPYNPQDISVFEGQEDTVWQYSATAHAYYHHKYYAFEPDLNIANDNVWQEVKAIVDFWLTFDVDGFRVDAATEMFARKGIEGTDVDAAGYMEDLRKFVDGRCKGVILLAEADVDPKQLKTYFGNGERMQMLYNFLLNNSLFLALAREKSGPIIKRLDNLRGVTSDGTWMNFVRNLDELDLGHLTNDELHEVFAAFAPEPDMHIYHRGIRRAVPPMMKNERQLRLVYSLLFAMPGAPMFVNGAEIGRGDDLSREGRESVRIPMQWNDQRNGGFSTAEEGSTDMTKSVIRSGPYSYHKVNVAQQNDDPTSLLNFFRSLTGLRHGCRAIGTDSPAIFDAGNPAILALAYDTVVILHNLSGAKQSFRVDMPKGAAIAFGEDYPKERALGPYGYSWINIQGGAHG